MMEEEGKEYIYYYLTNSKVMTFQSYKIYKGNCKLLPCFWNSYLKYDQM